MIVSLIAAYALCVYIVVWGWGYELKGEFEFWKEPVPFLTVLVAPATILIWMIAVSLLATFHDGEEARKSNDKQRV